VYTVSVLLLCVLLFCILAIVVYLYHFASTDCFNVAVVLQDFSKRIHQHQQ